MKPDPEIFFMEVLEKNKNKIFRICKVYGKDDQDAKDFFQEVLIQIWKSLPSFNEQASISTWIYRITLNVCMRASINAKKVRHTSLHGIDIKAEPASPFENQEKYQRLYTCISKLPDTEKSIVLLVLEDMSYKEISQIIGLSENHIAVKFKRLKEKLYNYLKQDTHVS